jgi:hypothetical protein
VIRVGIGKVVAKFSQNILLIQVFLPCLPQVVLEMVNLCVHTTPEYVCLIVVLGPSGHIFKCALKFLPYLQIFDDLTCPESDVVCLRVIYICEISFWKNLPFKEGYFSSTMF